MIKEINEQISENVFHESSFNDESKVLRNVRIMSANKSKNRRRYTDSAMESIAEKAEGCRMYLDHPEFHKTKDQIRSIRDFGGVFLNPKKSGNNISADLKCTANHWEMMKDLASGNFPVGMSIEARCIMGKEKDPDGNDIIESVTHLHAVSIVTQPAMTTTLKENIEKDKEVNIEEARADFLRTIDDKELTKKERLENFWEWIKEKK